MIYSYRVTAGQEHIVLDMLVNKIKKSSEGISAYYSSFRTLKDTFLLKLQTFLQLESCYRISRTLKEFYRRISNLDEIVTIAQARAQVIPVAKGDTVEFITGPFKGERAKVIQLMRQRIQSQLN